MQSKTYKHCLRVCDIDYCVGTNTKFEVVDIKFNYTRNTTNSVFKQYLDPKQ